MKYLLDQAEYDKLRNEHAERLRASKEELQAFCTLAARHIPIVREWSRDETPCPWGCILVDDRETNPGYCDRCPAQEICPYEGKEWSK